MQSLIGVIKIYETEEGKTVTGFENANRDRSYSIAEIGLLADVMQQLENGITFHPTLVDFGFKPNEKAA
jgi:hypothetical protein